MGRINRANLKKTIYYLRRNGIMKTWYAVRERAEEKSRPSYAWMPPSEAELEEQRCRWKEKGFSVVFSIIVPAYRTQPAYSVFVPSPTDISEMGADSGGCYGG